MYIFLVPRWREIEEENGERVDPVDEWRHRQFLKLGFDDWQALALSLDRADWHRVEEFLAGGATHEQVLAILT